MEREALTGLKVKMKDTVKEEKNILTYRTCMTSFQESSIRKFQEKNLGGKMAHITI